MKRFFQYVLRTTDVAAARDFYPAVLGSEGAQVVQLHEQAVARGARPHWLGCIDVGDLDAMAAAFQARGATPLGPRWLSPDGMQAAVIRDPGGAIVALAKPGPVVALAAAGPSGPEVVWHQLSTNDVERAKLNYGELLGWAFEAPSNLGEHGVIHPFTWQAGQPAVGAMGDIAQRPQVHPHWLFHFRVPSLDPALAAARTRGATVLGPFALPNADRVAICDDPQGAAFALLEKTSVV
jgi:predicted enzyme related to lactoylglutathione lyase